MTNHNPVQMVGEHRRNDRILKTGAFARLIAIPATSVAVVAAVIALTFHGSVAANAESRRACNNRTLRGDYGLIVSGVRALGPDVAESFIGTAIRTYDGSGRFEQVDNSHGTVTGAVTDTQASGIYAVNADCSGTSTIFLPGAPPIETTFVIVARGNEVNDIVMAPQPNLVTAVLKKVAE